MDDKARVERPAAGWLGLDLRPFFLGHARIMLEAQRLNPVGAPQIAHQPDKAGDAADAWIARGELFQLGADIEILALDADHPLNPLSLAGRSRPRRRRG